jgi:hypothetical protein
VEKERCSFCLAHCVILISQPLQQLKRTRRERVVACMSSKNTHTHEEEEQEEEEQY